MTTITMEQEKSDQQATINNEIETIETPEKETFFIYETNMELLQAKLTKLNKRAEKLNCKPMTINILSEELKEYDDEETETKGKRFDKIFEVELIGITPILNDWEFLGIIEKHEDNKNMIKLVNDLPDFPDYYKTWDNICEHCLVNRARKNYYIVRNVKTRQYKVVGKTCLKDFTGHSNPESYARMLEYSADKNWLEEFEGIPKGRGDYYIDLEEYLGYVAHEIRLNGWTSRGEAFNSYGHVQATADIAINDMFPPKYLPKDYVRVYPTNEDKEKAEKAIDWAKSFSEEEINDNTYTQNINIIAQEGFTTWKNIGFSASIVSSYIKHIEKEILRKQREKYKDSEKLSGYVGVIKQRITMDLTFLNEYTFDSKFGTAHIYKFLDQNSNVIIWKSNNWMGFDQGVSYTITGTIKEHKEYGDIKQTHITRCKVK